MRPRTGIVSAALAGIGLGAALWVGAALWAGSAAWAGAPAWLDRSQAIFLPRELSEKLAAQQRFPIFWWNFLILDEAGGGAGGDRSGGDRSGGDKADGLARARQACEYLREEGQGVIARSGCPENLAQFEGIVRDWARDYPLRSTLEGVGRGPRRWPARLKAAMDAALARASLPLDRSMIELLRADPLGRFHELEEHARRRLHLRIPRVAGFYHDEATHRWVIPVQLAFPPTEGARTRAFLRGLEALGAPWEMVGPHASTLANEGQVTRDLDRVSLAGMTLTALLCLAAAISGRWRLLLLLPPVGVAAGIGVLVTVAFCGSIHGLTLSFGVGIIGLAIDYGLLGALNSGSSRTWRANLMGLLTTLAGLLLLMRSSIPLLRQMMIFSATGLGVVFALFYLLHRLRPGWFRVEPLSLRLEGPGGWESGGWGPGLRLALALGLVGASLAGFVTLRPSLDMMRFNFQSPRAAELGQWLFARLERRPPLIQLSSGAGALDAAASQLDWARRHSIAVENAAVYLPSIAEQGRNLASWRRAFCARGGGDSGLLPRLDATRREFFQPFLSSLHCASLQPFSPESKVAPAYLSDLHSGRQWLTLWFPESDEQSALIRSRFPEAVSLKEIVGAFPLILERELRWMAPTAFLLATLLLFAYYGGAVMAIIALLPFFSGMGVVALGAWLFGLSFSFVSVIGLVMVFGFSFDYGIFATEIPPVIRADPDRRVARAVLTSLGFAALSTISGFAPLLLCRHPVLRDLGQTLFLGAAGTYLGAIWGVPALARAWRRREGRAGEADAK